MNSGKQPLDNGDRIAREYKQHTVHTRPAYYPHSSPSPFYRLQAMGLKPCVALREMVIAEPSASVGRQGRGMDTLKDEMFLIQMNFDTVQREYGLLKRNPFQKDLLNGYVDFMGSDCHGVEYRKYFIVPSVKWMKEKLPEAYFRKLLIDNPRKILEKTY